MLKKSRFLAILALLTLLMQGAGAQELKPLPELDSGFDLAAYATKTDTIRRDFESLPHVGFEMTLPKTWVERTTLGQDFGELVRFDGPAFGDVRPYFSFKRIQINRENSARNELVAYMLKSGYTLRSIREIDDRNVETMYVVNDDRGDEFAVRAFGRIQGPSLLLAEYAIPSRHWDKFRDEQTYAIKSFKFTKDNDEPIEKRYERTYHRSLRFFYPASWVFEGEVAQSENQVVITLSNPGMAGIKNGEIRLGLYAGRSLIGDDNPQIFVVDVPTLLKDIKARYTGLGYDVGEAIERHQTTLNLPVKFSALEVYQLRTRLTEYDKTQKEPVSQELWIAVFQTKEDRPRTFMLELLTPARKQDIYLWSVNTRAFEIILKSIQ